MIEAKNAVKRQSIIKQTKIISKNFINSIKNKNNILNNNVDKNYRLIDENEIETIYNDKKIIENPNISLHIEKLPNCIKKHLHRQEKSLNLSQTHLNDHFSLSNRISKILQRSKEDLLMYNYGNYRVKKELKESKSLDQKSGIFNWILSLRNDKLKNENKSAFVNIGNEINPLWQVLRSNQKTETIRKIDLNTISEKEDKILKVRIFGLIFD